MTLKLQLVLLLFPIMIGNITAQESILSAGGESIGSNGSASFSVGQVFYSFQSNGNYSLSEGVQQPFNEEINTSTENKENKLQYSFYPNPTTNTVTVEINDFIDQDLSYKIINMNGETLKNKLIDNNKTIIEFQNIPKGNYIINIIGKEKTIQSIQIIKQ